MSDYSITSLMLSFVFAGVVIFSFITGTLIFIAENGSDELINNFTQQLDINELNESLTQYRSESDNQENVTLEQKMKEFDEAKGFDVLPSVKSLWSVAKGTFNALINIVTDIFHVPSWIIGLFVGIVVVLGIIGLYKLWRIGEG